MAYYAIHHRPHRTMTELEQAKLLKVTGEHARGFRDHVLFALALGTGLREHEALALDVGDITEDGTTISSAASPCASSSAAPSGRHRRRSSCPIRCTTSLVAS